MSRVYLPLILTLLIVLQGAAVQLVPTSISEAGWIVVIHSVLLFLILLKLFYDLENTYYVLIFAILSGLIIDIIYTDIIGVYMFSYSILVFFVHGMRKVLHANFYVATMLTFVSIGVVDFLLYLIYQFIGVVRMDLTVYLSHRLMPTLIVNMILFFLFYLLLKKRLVKWSNERFDHKQSAH
ncbi:rod shape-determining protein MreD [Amphibacillus sp. MSJ-3]|uniref:rod shape-determining protein MreD n=1 Tax=Amphibacillus sp. MSJ-3 TaxID=2841505 RepID=UPI001C0ED68F|nr:rod shape-determining protein MreD [Amphibacillus sp. MSJ-3]MBU5593597.1 rod shape-determining protein MreD [Amphibacillus sp. MSJ-3]